MAKDFWEKVRFFKRSEFACPCCGRCEMSEELIFKLDHLRKCLGEPIIITSGFRCEFHNKVVGGAPDSSHLKGLAVDISIPTSAYRYNLITYAVILRIPRIGIGANFIHLDIDKSKPCPVMWVY